MGDLDSRALEHVRKLAMETLAEHLAPPEAIAGYGGHLRRYHPAQCGRACPEHTMDTLDGLTLIRKVKGGAAAMEVRRVLRQRRDDR